MAGMGRVRRRLTTGRLFEVRHTSGRAAWQIAAFLLWTLTMSQVLVVVHPYTHPLVQTSATCGICLLAPWVAHVPEAPSEPLGPRTLRVPLATPVYTPYVRPVHKTRQSRAPPLLRSISAVA